MSMFCRLTSRFIYSRQTVHLARKVSKRSCEVIDWTHLNREEIARDDLWHGVEGVVVVLPEHNRLERDLIEQRLEVGRELGPLGRDLLSDGILELDDASPRGRDGRSQPARVLEIVASGLTCCQRVRPAQKTAGASLRRTTYPTVSIVSSIQGGAALTSARRAGYHASPRELSS